MSNNVPIVQTYDLNIIPNTIPIVVPVSQYDEGRVLNFKLYQGDEPFWRASITGLAFTIRGTKKDNTGFIYSPDSVTVPASSTEPIEVSFILTNQMSVFAGDVMCEVRVGQGSDVIGTANFVLRVEPTPLKDDTIISETDIPAIQAAEANAIRAENAANQAEYVVGNAVYYVNNIAPTGANKNVELGINDIPLLSDALQELDDNKIPYRAYKEMSNDTDFDTFTASTSGVDFFITTVSANANVNQPLVENANRQWLVNVAKGTGNYIFQTAYRLVGGDIGGEIYYRYFGGGGTWYPWKKLAIGSDIGFMQEYTDKDFNDADLLPANNGEVKRAKIYISSSGTYHAPNSSTGMTWLVETVKVSNNYYIQHVYGDVNVAVSYASIPSLYFYRVKYSSSNWTQYMSYSRNFKTSLSYTLSSTSGIYHLIPNYSFNKNGAGVYEISGAFYTGYNNTGAKHILTLGDVSDLPTDYANKRFLVQVEGPGASLCTTGYFDSSGKFYVYCVLDFRAMTGNSYYYFDIVYM